MALKVPNLGELFLLLVLRSNWPTLSMGLFVSDYTPADGDNLATYTAIEATFPGYARVDLTGWTFPAADGAGRARTAAALVTFTRTVTGSPQFVWGYFVTEPGGTLLWAERHPAPPVRMELAADVFRVNPAFTLRSEV